MPHGICSIEGCERVEKLKRGWCEKHYCRWRAHGDPLTILTSLGQPPIARILGGAPGRPGLYVVDDVEAVLARLWRSTAVDAATGCWEWQGSRTDDGYGEVRIKSQCFFTHRLGWVATGHLIPEGEQLDHLCRNSPCWSPAHLEPVTNQENTKRGLRGQFRCDHNPTGVDIYYSKDGRRRCAICNRAWQAARRRRRSSVLVLSA